MHNDVTNGIIIMILKKVIIKYYSTFEMFKILRVVNWNSLIVIVIGYPFELGGRLLTSV